MISHIGLRRSVPIPNGRNRVPAYCASWRMDSTQLSAVRLALPAESLAPTETAKIAIAAVIVMTLTCLLISLPNVKVGQAAVWMSSFVCLFRARRTAQPLVGNPDLFSSKTQTQTRFEPPPFSDSPTAPLRHFPDELKPVRSACRAITRGSGGETPTHLFFPTSRLAGGSLDNLFCRSAPGSPYVPNLLLGF